VTRRTADARFLDPFDLGLRLGLPWAPFLIPLLLYIAHRLALPPAPIAILLQRAHQSATNRAVRCIRLREASSNKLAAKGRSTRAYTLWDHWTGLQNAHELVVVKGSIHLPVTLLRAANDPNRTTCIRTELPHCRFSSENTTELIHQSYLP
jgi:hypothetical protein